MTVRTITPSKLPAAKTVVNVMVKGSELSAQHIFEQEGKFLIHTQISAVKHSLTQLILVKEQKN